MPPHTIVTCNFVENKAVSCVLFVLFQKFRLEVGTQAMDLLINVLQTDRCILFIKTLVHVLSTVRYFFEVS